MNKLEDFLIKQLATNHNLTIDALTEVIEGCNNPTAALEILLGIADDHNLPDTAKDIRGETNRTLVSVNRVTESVEYTYNKVITKYKYKDEWVDRSDLYYKLRENNIDTSTLDDVIKDLEESKITTDQVYQGKTSMSNWTR